jgi:hypothetical protein
MSSLKSKVLTFEQIVQKIQEKELEEARLRIAHARANVDRLTQELQDRESLSKKRVSVFSVFDHMFAKEMSHQEPIPVRGGPVIDPLDQKRIYEELVNDLKIDVIGELRGNVQALPGLFAPGCNVMTLCQRLAKEPPKWFVDKYGEDEDI